MSLNSSKEIEIKVGGKSEVWYELFFIAIAESDDSACYRINLNEKEPAYSGC